jgi:hypothetical protein
MNYYYLLASVAGIAYWKRMEILDLCFTGYAKGKMFLDKHFPREPFEQRLVKILVRTGKHKQDITQLLKERLESGEEIVYSEVGDDAIIEMYYMVGDDEYICLFNNVTPIKFPLYEMSEIVRYKEGSQFKNKILSASLNNNDYTDLINKYYGPLEDFHKGVGMIIRNNHIWDNNDSTLEIIDSFVETYQFKGDDELNL